MDRMKKMKLDMKKFNQKDLRRLMQEQKSKLDPKPPLERIVSPLAKYDSLGNLTCLICRTLIKSENVWKVHINSKQHKRSVEETKQLKDKLLKSPASRKELSEPSSRAERTDELRDARKDIIKKTHISVTENNSPTKTTTTTSENIHPKSGPNDDILPEKFFDDPIKDAKIRNTEYKDPQDEEWERFQREIKEESVMSNAIIAGEQDDAAAERHIVEIDEQMQRWARVINLEERKELVLSRVKQKNATLRGAISKESLSSGEESDSFEEYSDWRSKRFRNGY